MHVICYFETISKLVLHCLDNMNSYSTPVLQYPTNITKYSRKLHLPKEDHWTLQSCCEVKCCMCIAFRCSAFTKITDHAEVVLRSLEGVCSTRGWNKHECVKGLLFANFKIYKETTKIFEFLLWCLLKLLIEYILYLNNIMYCNKNKIKRKWNKRITTFSFLYHNTDL